MRIRQTARFRGFTMVEILVVVSIIGVLLSLTVQSMKGFSESMEITNAYQMVTAKLTLARDLALSRNQYAQVRLLSPNDAGDSRSGHFTALAVYLSDSPLYGTESEWNQWKSEGRIRQEGRVLQLPNSCAIIDNPDYSSLISTLKGTPDATRHGTMEINGKSYEWTGFYFKPDGSVDANIGSGCLSIASCLLYKIHSKMPPNFATIIFDPINGNLQGLRP